MTQPKVCLFFVVDGEKLEAQACLLAPSIRQHQGWDVPVIAYHREDYEVSAFAVGVLEACKVERVAMPGTGADDPNPWSRHWPVGNKLLAKAQRRECDISVYLDTDMVFRAPVDFAAELGDGEVLACVADYAFAEPLSLDRWAALYGFFGLSVPDKRVRLRAGRKLEMPPYFNGGFAVFREAGVGEAMAHFGEAWLEDSLAIDHAEGFEDAREGLDQTLYPVTIERLGARFVEGRQAINFNVQAHGLPSGADVAIAHYHTFPTILRRQPKAGFDALMGVKEVLGEDRLRGFIERYRTVLEWDRPRFLVPALLERTLAGEGARNLSDLATIYGSDKGPVKHRYAELYQMLFWPYVDREINMLEMGLLIGGPEGGFDKDRVTRDLPSIRMWLQFFKRAKIYGLDVSDFSWFQHERFQFFRCDMEDRAALSEVAAEVPEMDIIIDDASHASHHQQNAFLKLFPKLKSGGLYIIEDLRWQPKAMEPRRITKTGELFEGFQRERKFRHIDRETAAAFNALAGDISGCFLFQEGYRREDRNQVAVIHKR